MSLFLFLIPFSHLISLTALLIPVSWLSTKSITTPTIMKAPVRPFPERLMPGQVTRRDPSEPERLTVQHNHLETTGIYYLDLHFPVDFIISIHIQERCTNNHCDKNYLTWTKRSSWNQYPNRSQSWVVTKNIIWSDQTFWSHPINNIKTRFKKSNVLYGLGSNTTKS